MIERAESLTKVPDAFIKFLVALAVVWGCGALVLWPDEAHADEGGSYHAAAVSSWSKISGGCEWGLDSGKLVIRPAGGAGEAALPEFNSAEETPWYASRTNIRSIQVDSGVKATSAAYLFAGLDNLRSVTTSDLAGLDLSEAMSLSHMFADCTALVSVDLSNLSAPLVTDLSSLLENCSDCRTVTFAGMKTGSLTTMAYLFSGCNSLTSVDLSPFDTSTVENLSYLLSGCSSLKTFDATAIDTSSAETIAGFFKNCTTLQRIDVSRWNTGNVKSTSEMFMHCEELRSVDISNWDVSNLRISGSMFRGCLHLTSIDLSAFKNSHNLTDAFRMFCLCSRLESIDLRDIDFSGIDRLEEVFYACQALKRVDARGADFSNVGSAFRAFSSCTSLETADFTGAKLGNLTTAEGMFLGCANLKRVDFTNADLSSLTGITQICYGCSSLTDFITTGVKAGTIGSGLYAFNGCESIDKLDLSQFTAKASLSNLFTGCYVNSYKPMKNYAGDSPKTRPDISKATFSKLADHVFAGSYFTPSLTLSVPNNASYVWGSLWGKDLIEGEHYTVSYKANYSVGKAKVTVTGVGAFKGSVTKTFKILPKGTTVSKLAGKAGAIKVTWKKQAKQTNGYQLRYKANGSSSWKTVTVSSPTTTTKTITGLKANTQYTVQVRTYKTVSGTKYYSSWSASKAAYAR